MINWLSKASNKLGILIDLDVESFLNEFLVFNDIHYRNVKAFFEGVIVDQQSESFNQLDIIYERSEYFQNSISNVRTSLRSLDLWSVVELIDNIHLQLHTIKNISIWLRSSIATYQYNPQVRIDYSLNQGQTLESVVQGVVRSNDENAWVDLAVDNGLSELDYSHNSQGITLKISLSRNITSQSITSVADNVNGINLYGKDISKQITFQDDDLVTLSFKETLHQSVGILTKLEKGDAPINESLGLQMQSLIGQNIASISFPMLFRQLAQTFATDDSFKGIVLNDLKRDQDNIIYTFTVQTKFDEFVQQNLTL